MLKLQGKKPMWPWERDEGLGQKTQVKEKGEVEKDSLGQGKGKGNFQGP